MAVWSSLRFNCGREMANRFAMAPLTTDSSHEDGTAPDNEIEFVRRRSASGFGATISSAAYIEQHGRSWQGIGAAHEGHLASLSRLAEAMRAVEHSAGGIRSVPTDENIVLPDSGTTDDNAARSTPGTRDTSSRIRA